VAGDTDENGTIERHSQNGGRKMHSKLIPMNIQLFAGETGGAGDPA
jgi:hypothetical protein